MHAHWLLFLLAGGPVGAMIYGLVRLIAEVRTSLATVTAFAVLLGSTMASVVLVAIVKIGKVDDFVPSVLVASAAGLATFVAVLQRHYRLTNPSHDARIRAGLLGAIALVVFGLLGMAYVAFGVLGFHE